MSAELRDLGDRVVAQAAPGEQIEVVASRGTSTSVRAYDGEVEAFTSATSHSLGVRVIVNGRQGFATAGSHEPDVVAEALAAARDNAEFATPDDHVGLAEPDGVVAADIDPWSPSVEAMDDIERIALAVDLEARVRGADARITGVRTASYGDGVSEWALVSTAGMRVGGRSSRAGASVQALAADGSDTTTGYGYHSARDAAGVDVAAVAADAVDRAVSLLGASKPRSTRLAVVLEPRQASSILGIAASMLSGDRVLRGRSPFAGRLGDDIAAPMLTVVDDPTDERSLAADAYDGEGFATRPNLLIDRGRLDRFLYDATSARRAGTVSTASAVRSARSTPSVGTQALVVEPGEGSFDDAVADVELGVWVYSMSGLHSGVNAVSGDFSVGVEGRMIRDGEPAEPIREATMASTVPRMLADVVAVGADIEWLPNGDGMPTVVIGGVSLGGS